MEVLIYELNPRVREEQRKEHIVTFRREHLVVREEVMESLWSSRI